MSEEKKNIFKFRVIKTLLKLAYKHRFIFIISLIFTIFLAIIIPIRPWLIQLTFDYFIKLGTQGLKLENNTFLIDWYFSFLNNIKSYFNLNSNLNITISIIFITLFLEFIGHYFQSLYSGFLGQMVIKDLRLKVYEKIMSLRTSFFDTNSIGKLITRTISDIETIAEVFSSGLITISGDLLKIFILIIVMFTLNVKLTLISLSTIPILIWVTNYFRKGIKKSFQKVRDDVAKLNSFVQEFVSGIKIVKIFNQEERTMKEFTKYNDNHKKSNIEQIWYYSIYFPVVEIVIAISIGLLVWIGSLEVLSGKTTPGELMAFILYINMIFRPLRQIADNINTLQLGFVGAERVFNILDNEEKIEDKGELVFKNIKGSVEFRNVSFSYDKKSQVLSNINFKIEEGKMLAIVGPTGAGKSTIINLLNRFYELNQGEILIDNINIKKFKLNELRRNITTILQDVFLFSGSILDNITMFNESINLSAVEKATQEIGLESFINRFPDKFYQKVGERGGMLSLGERQLIAFIRALIYKSSILVLDEATSSVDTESEALLQKATQKIAKYQTSIVIAHRISTIHSSDNIIVLNQGEIEEEGNHNFLIQNNGLYSKLNLATVING